MDVIHSNPGNPVAEVRIIGHLDTLEAPLLLEKVTPIAETATVLILDCSEMPYLTSTGLRALMRLGKAVLAHQGKMIICGLDGLAKTIYTSAGFSQMFPPLDSIEDAREAAKEAVQ